MANAATIRERGSDGIEFTAATPASQPGDVFPAGVILHYAGAAVPTGWLACDGSIITIATYPNLFSALSTLYGGDGITTFGIPDMRGRVPVGKHSSGTFVTLGLRGGEENHTLTTAEMPVHTHGFTGNAMGGHAHTLSVNSTTATTSQGNVVNDADGLGTHLWGTAGTQVSTTPVLISPHTHTGSALSASAGTPSGTNANSGSGSTHNNMPPYIVVHHIIRAY